VTAITPLAISGVLLIEPKRHGDERGFFSETFNARTLAEAGFDRPFVQDNHSKSSAAGTIRGLHFQAPPHAQDKLIRVTAGAVLDVVVDIRRSSPTYGMALQVELSAGNWRQLLAPRGVAHGFCTLTEGAEVLYKVTDYYAPESEGGLLWNDPALGIDWPFDAERATLNARDRSWGGLADFQSPFE